MIRTLSILAALPCLAGCDLADLINPGKASQEAYAYRASITATQAPAAPVTPGPAQVAEIPAPAAVDIPEPVYVAPEPPAPYVPPLPPTECTYSLYMIFDCIDGKVRML